MRWNGLPDGLRRAVGLAGYGVFCLKADRPDTLAIFQNVSLFLLAELAVDPQPASDFFQCAGSFVGLLK
jgi:hypothetical protein